ncbi:hypothetical protein F4861DRAFT_330105 [Xylaria intraflava]|nr:hypothetical protein F4861DRAFT_330105 [Xylaria intraflava]
MRRILIFAGLSSVCWTAAECGGLYSKGLVSLVMQLRYAVSLNKGRHGFLGVGTPRWFSLARLLLRQDAWEIPKGPDLRVSDR